MTMTDHDKQAKLAGALGKIAKEIARVLPASVQDAYKAAMASEAIKALLPITNTDMLEAAVNLSLAAARYNVDFDEIANEVARRTTTLRKLTSAMQSVTDDLNAYPPRWPGL